MSTDVREFTARDLKLLLDRGDDLFVVDLRHRPEFEAWRIEGRKPIPGLNVPYVEILGDGDTDDPAEAFTAYARKEWEGQLPRDRMILAVCARGGTSAFLAQALRGLGYDAANLQGGMIAWGNYYDVRPVVESEALHIYQFNRPARGCLSYVLVSGEEAVVVDPLRHVDHYLDFIRNRRLRVTAVLDTHVHADHISGGRRLADLLGVPYYFHPYDSVHPIDVVPAAIDVSYLHPDQEFTFGSTRIKALHIPGHTLGNIAYLAGDRYLLTGDSIFIESVARPDLGGRGETWAPMHYRSLARLLTLPDETVVLPGHFSSPAEANADGLYVATLGELKAKNEGLRMVLEGEEAFVRYMLCSLPVFPPQYVDIKRVNTGLLRPDEEKASELELGRNICALAQAYQH